MAEDLEFIATFDNPLLANIAKGRLEAEGISAFLHNERFVEMNWQWSNAVGGIGLLVPTVDAQRARSILARPNGELQGESQEMPEDPVDADEVLVEPNLRELDAARAIKSAVLGLLFCPLQAYTAWLLFMVVMADEPLRPRYYWCSLGAAALLVPHVAAATSMLWLLYW